MTDELVALARLDIWPQGLVKQARKGGGRNRPLSHSEAARGTGTRRGRRYPRTGGVRGRRQGWAAVSTRGQLSRIHCHKCGYTTLHCAERCVHCKTQATAVTGAHSWFNGEPARARYRGGRPGKRGAT